MIRGLIFDFDGLILDTEVPDYQSWAEIYEAHGCTLPREDWIATIGLGANANPFCPYGTLESLLGRSVDREALRLQRRKRYLEMIHAEAIRAGIENYIAGAKRQGMKLGVASSSDCAWVHGHLERIGLHAHFDAIRCADDVTHTKPHPELYLTTLEALGLKPHEAIAFEDSPHGTHAARRAGIFCVAVPNPMTHTLPLEHADLRLDSLAALPLPDLLTEVAKRRL